MHSQSKSSQYHVGDSTEISRRGAGCLWIMRAPSNAMAIIVRATSKPMATSKQKRATEQSPDHRLLLSAGINHCPLHMWYIVWWLLLSAFGFFQSLQIKCKHITRDKKAIIVAEVWHLVWLAHLIASLELTADCSILAIDWNSFGHWGCNGTILDDYDHYSALGLVMRVGAALYNCCAHFGLWHAESNVVIWRLYPLKIPKEI